MRHARRVMCRDAILHAPDRDAVAPPRQRKRETQPLFFYENGFFGFLPLLSEKGEFSRIFLLNQKCTPLEHST
ncbi:MAG: hypothetical protein ACK55Z_14945, partial [bacterium]